MALALGLAARFERIHLRWVGWGGVGLGVLGLLATPFAHDAFSAVFLVWWVGLAVVLLRDKSPTGVMRQGRRFMSCRSCGHEARARPSPPPSSHSPARASRWPSRPRGPDRWNGSPVGAVVAAYAAVGVLIVWHRPENPVGRIAVTMAALWGVGEALVDLGARGLREDAADRGAALAVAGRQCIRWGGVAGARPVAAAGLPRRARAGDPAAAGTARLVVGATLACFLTTSVLCCT